MILPLLFPEYVHVGVQRRVWVHPEELDVPFVERVVDKLNGEHAAFIALAAVHLLELLHKSVSRLNGSRY